METPNICQQGTIKEIKENLLFVEIERSAACASCHAKGACLASQRKSEIVPIYTEEPNAYQVEELVSVKIKRSMGTKAVLIAYLFPFLVLALGLFLTYYLTKNELLSIGVSFVATALYFLIIKKIDNKLKKHFIFSVSKIIE
jgi:sigma-E factor negative regulatory protein RseC